MGRLGGTDAGRLLAYDQVSVGGLGLTSVSIDRTVVRAENDAAPAPSGTARPTGQAAQ